MRANIHLLVTVPVSRNIHALILGICTIVCNMVTLYNQNGMTHKVLRVPFTNEQNDEYENEARGGNEQSEYSPFVHYIKFTHIYYH